MKVITINMNEFLLDPIITTQSTRGLRFDDVVAAARAQAAEYRRMNDINVLANGGPIKRRHVNEWKAAMNRKFPWLELGSNEASYDYERYYNENYDEAWSRLDKDAYHFPDKYKLETHKTFSNDSMFSKGENHGGHWTNEDTFIPSTVNLQVHPEIYKERKPYTENEIYGQQYAQGGGLSRSKDYGSKKKPYPSVKSGDFAGGDRSYPIPTKADAVDALRLAGLHHRADVKAKVYKKYPSLKHPDGGPLNQKASIIGNNFQRPPYSGRWINDNLPNPFYNETTNNYLSYLKFKNANPTQQTNDGFSFDMRSLNKDALNYANNAYNHLLSKTSHRNAIAIMANIMQESTFNPYAIQKGGDKAQGYFQFHGKQLNDYNKYLAENKLANSDIAQLDYILDLINGNRPDFYTEDYNDFLKRWENVKKYGTTKEKTEYEKYYNNVYKSRVDSNRLFPISDLKLAFDNDEIPLEDLIVLFGDTIERPGKPEYDKRKKYGNVFNNNYSKR